MPYSEEMTAAEGFSDKKSEADESAKDIEQDLEVTALATDSRLPESSAQVNIIFRKISGTFTISAKNKLGYKRIF